MKRYQVIRGLFSVGFNTLVEKMLADGWELQGGVSVDRDDYVYQAITKEESPTPAEESTNG